MYTFYRYKYFIGKGANVDNGHYFQEEELQN